MSACSLGASIYQWVQLKIMIAWKGLTPTAPQARTVSVAEELQLSTQSSQQWAEVLSELPFVFFYQGVATPPPLIHC